MENPNSDQRPAPEDTKQPKSDRHKASFWSDELKSSDKFLKCYLKQGSRVVDRFLDDRAGVDGEVRSADGLLRLNLFNSNIRTMQDMLYSNLPSVEVDRTNADANDDVARVAAEIMERLLNLDIVDNEASYDNVLRSALQDRLLPGMGCARVRYEFDSEVVLLPPMVDPMTGIPLTEPQEVTQVTDERAPVDYFHWQDVRWGWARNFAEIPWIGYRSYLSKQEAAERFGKEHAKQLTYRKQKLADDKHGQSRPEDDSPWNKAEIWELWDKPTKSVVWYSPGYDKLLDTKPDPLRLKRFFPSPEFLMANSTTSVYRPVSDFHMCQDLYNEIDTLSTRISILTTAVKAVGVYDASADGVKRMFKEGFENDLVPVDDWAMFAETGGLQGAIDWMPIMDIVNALDKLRQLRDETITLLQQISGMADVMQGGLQNQYEGVGQTQIKAQFGSARLQALQDNFANFAGNLLQLKAEVICKHFKPENILKYSGMEFSMDADLLQPAIELLKQPEMAHIRIQVRPEQIAMIDYAKLKVERTEFMTAMATFMQSAGPMLEVEPSSMPVLLQMLQWTMAGFKGSAQIEGVLDKAIEAAQKKAQEAAENPPEDPAAAEAAAKQAEAQQKLNGELQKIQAKAQADMALRQQDMQADIQTTMAATQAKLQEVEANHAANMREIKAKMQADVLLERVQNQGNIEVNQAAADAEMEKDMLSRQLDIDSELQKASIEIDKERRKTGLAIEQAGFNTRTKLAELAAQQTYKSDQEPSNGE
jgi:hypothetical protein